MWLEHVPTFISIPWQASKEGVTIREITDTELAITTSSPSPISWVFEVTTSVSQDAFGFVVQNFHSNNRSSTFYKQSCCLIPSTMTLTSPMFSSMTVEVGRRCQSRLVLQSKVLESYSPTRWLHMTNFK